MLHRLLLLNQGIVFFPVRSFSFLIESAAVQRLKKLHPLLPPSASSSAIFSGQDGCTFFGALVDGLPIGGG